jgi:hypothetical protein
MLHELGQRAISDSGEGIVGNEKTFVATGLDKVTDVIPTMRRLQSAKQFHRVGNVQMNQAVTAMKKQGIPISSPTFSREAFAIKTAELLAGEKFLSEPKVLAAANYILGLNQ